MTLRLSELTTGVTSSSEQNIAENQGDIAELQAATEVTPDPSISLEAGNVGDAIDELAGDLHELNNAPDFALLFLNSLI